MFKKIAKYFGDRKQAKIEKRQAEIAPFAAALQEASGIEDPAEKLLALEKAKKSIAAAKTGKEERIEIHQAGRNLCFLLAGGGGFITTVAVSLCMLAGSADSLKLANIENMVEIDVAMLTGVGALTRGLHKRRDAANAFDAAVKGTEKGIDRESAKAAADRDGMVGSVFFHDALQARPDLKDAFLESMQKTILSAQPKSPRPKKTGQDAHV